MEWLELIKQNSITVAFIVAEIYKTIKQDQNNEKGKDSEINITNSRITFISNRKR